MRSWSRLWNAIQQRVARRRRAPRADLAWFGMERLEPRILRSATLFDTDLLHALHAPDESHNDSTHTPHPHLLHVGHVDRADHGLSLDLVAQVMADDETIAKGRLEISEAGDSATFSVVLDSQPTAPVVIPVFVRDSDEAELSTEELVFTPENWNQPQTVTVTGLDDAADDGDQEFTVELGPARSDDPSYDGLDAPDVRVLNYDNDEPAPAPEPDPAPMTPSFTPPENPTLPPTATPLPFPESPSLPPIVAPPPFIDHAIPAIEIDNPRDALPGPTLDLPHAMPGAGTGGSSEPDAPVADVAPEQHADQPTATAEPAPSEPAPPPEPSTELAITPAEVDAPDIAPAINPAAMPTFAYSAARYQSIVTAQNKPLDAAATQLRDAAAELSRQQSIAVVTTVGSLGAFTGGYLIWAVRGGSLMGSFLMTLPAWRTIDPIPVLEFAAYQRDTRKKIPNSNHADELFESTNHREGGAA